MATQTVEFATTPGQTLTLKLYAEGSDTEAGSASATEATNRKGVYTAAFTDEDAGTYRAIAYSGSIAVASGWVTLAAATGTYYATVDRQADLATSAADATASNQTTIIGLLQGGVSVSYSRPTWDGTTWTEPIVAGDSYIDNGTQDSRLKVTISNYSGRALADATIKLNASRNGATFQLTADEVETVDATTFILDFAPTAADTAGFTKGGYVFNVVAEWTDPTEKTTLIREADKANLFVATRVDAG